MTLPTHTGGERKQPAKRAEKDTGGMNDDRPLVEEDNGEDEDLRAQMLNDIDEEADILHHLNVFWLDALPHISHAYLFSDPLVYSSFLYPTVSSAVLRNGVMTVRVRDTTSMSVISS
ncbi:unnamed protein product [Toxocara canis]|uniref:Lon N-terminal domain-containing protein n=1 Tax=Toxocara canis TaxID=6265 RepID=A0A183TVJ9_TOXCA|nr:unnamed protein product [Toxocara canis]